MHKRVRVSIPLAAYMASCFLFLFSTSASAYIDPSTTTFLIQAVAGVAVAIGAFVTIYWRKAKKKIQNTLHIDENANKEVEEEIRVNDDSTSK